MGFNVGMSGSDKDSYVESRNLGVGETPNGMYSPRTDFAYRGGDLLNQFAAQQNLLFGGAGYGGSFESADQRAARAAGGSLNSKPYGGWGGYGSQNPVMTNPQTGSPAPPTSSPVGPSGEYPAPTPYNPPQSQPWNQPPQSVPPYIPQHQPWNQPTQSVPPYNPQHQQWEQPVQTIQAPQSAIVPGSAGTPQSITSTGGVSLSNFKTNNYDDLLKLQDPNVQASLNQEYEANMAKNGLKTGANKPWYLQPDLVELKSDLVAKGMNPDSDLQWGDVQRSLAAGVPLDTIKSHYSTLLDKIGPNAMDSQHRALARLDPEKLKNGTQTQATLANWGGSGPEAPLKPVTPTAPPKKAAIPGMNSVQTVPEAAAMTAKAPGATPQSSQTDPVAAFFQALQGGVGQVTESPAFKEWASQQSWKGWTPQNNIQINPDGTINTNPGANQSPAASANTANAYEQFSKVTIPPSDIKGEKPSGPQGTGGTGGGPPPIGTGDLGGGGTTDGTGGYDPNSPYGPAGGIQYPSWGNVWTWQEPKMNPDGTIARGPDGKPIFETKSKSKWEFEQGQNDGMTADAWSTSAQWRPGEPTGGIYGAFSDLASGNLTDYENQIGQNWKNYAANPAQAEDVGYQNALAEYNKTPGKGIDEAYGAYDKMLRGNGYSNAEKGAIEGSAVRGASTGYQRSADEMRRQAARTGDPSAAYGALSNIGASYGRDLGEINRQNQLKFADEAQRRHETGASGMTNVASLANTKAQFGLNSQQQYANELARRRETGNRGMGDYATFGRGLQQQGISGLSDLYKQNTGNVQNMYGAIANLLNQSYGSAATNNSKGFGWNTGLSV